MGGPAPSLHRESTDSLLNGHTRVLKNTDMNTLAYNKFCNQVIQFLSQSIMLSISSCKLHWFSSLRTWMWTCDSSANVRLCTFTVHAMYKSISISSYMNLSWSFRAHFTRRARILFRQQWGISASWCKYLPLLKQWLHCAILPALNWTSTLHVYCSGLKLTLVYLSVYPSCMEIVQKQLLYMYI